MCTGVQDAQRYTLQVLFETVDRDLLLAFHAHIARRLNWSLTFPSRPTHQVEVHSSPNLVIPHPTDLEGSRPTDRAAPRQLPRGDWEKLLRPVSSLAAHDIVSLKTTTSHYT